jgi:flagellar FliL protein
MAEAQTDAPPKPGAFRPMTLILGVVLALAGASAGYVAVSKGLVDPRQLMAASDDEAEKTTKDDEYDIAYVELDPILISLNSDLDVQHLRFRAHLEVEAVDMEAVQKVLPRVVDVLNSYLRALEISDLRDPLALTKLRSQMLRRIQIVVGEGRVRDLLIMDFVLT